MPKTVNTREESLPYINTTLCVSLPHTYHFVLSFSIIITAKKHTDFCVLKTKKNIFFFSWVINKSRGEIEIEASFVESSSLKRNQNGRKWLDKQLLGSYTGRGSSLRRCKVVSFAQRARPLQPHSLFRWGSHHWLRWDRSPPFLG